MKQNDLKLHGHGTYSDSIYDDCSFQDFLLHEHHISQQQHHFLIYERKRGNKDIATLLVEMGILTQAALSHLFSQWQGDELCHKFTMQESDPSIHKLFTRNDAESLQAVPIEIKDNRVVVAMVDSFNCLAKDKILYQFPEVSDVQAFPVLQADFYSLLDQIYGSNENIECKDTDPQNLEVQDFLSNLFKRAVKLRASDIHFEPGERLVRVRFRLDGVLQPALVFHKDLWILVSIRLKMLSDLNIAESRLPQFGRYSMSVDGRRLDCRLSTHPTQYGESIVVRLLDQNKALYKLNDLGLSDYVQSQLDQLIKSPQGLIIVTGPTGSGKTTTLYALLAMLDAHEKKIVTLEDPIEYKMFHIQQTEVCESIGMGFAEGLRSILRQDPDVILLGEVRDTDTAQMALRAALTGHLVLTTLHTNDAIGAISRMVDLKVPTAPLAEVMIGVMSQRLLRLSCLCCHGDPSLPPSDYGCTECNFTGYKGRTAISELITVDANLRDMIAAGSSRLIIENYLKQTGYKNIQDQAKDLFNQGMTTKHEIERVLGNGSLSHRS